MLLLKRGEDVQCYLFLMPTQIRQHLAMLAKTPGALAIHVGSPLVWPRCHESVRYCITGQHSTWDHVMPESGVGLGKRRAVFVVA